MKKKIIGFAMGTILCGTQNIANAVEITDGLNANLFVTALSDYRANGVSQTRGGPAIQGDLFLMHDSGAIGGLWMSNVDYGTETRLEEGGYVGIYKEPMPDLSITATVGRYMYPKNSSYSVNEFYSAIEYKNFRYSYIYDWAMEGPNAVIQYFGYTFPLPSETKLYVEYGYHNVGDVLYSSDGSTSDVYQTYKASLKKNLFDIDWSLSYIDTSLSSTECLYFMGYTDSCGETLVLGATKAF